MLQALNLRLLRRDLRLHALDLSRSIRAQLSARTLHRDHPAPKAYSRPGFDAAIRLHTWQPSELAADDTGTECAHERLPARCEVEEARNTEWPYQNAILRPASAQRPCRR
eukprot:3703438-Pleurochrysis_carterae.AAC.2